MANSSINFSWNSVFTRFKSCDFHLAVILSWLALIVEHYYEMMVNELNVSNICSQTILPSATNNKKCNDYLPLMNITSKIIDR